MSTIGRARAARRQRFVAAGVGILLAAVAIFVVVIIASRPVEDPDGGGVRTLLGDDEFQAGRADRLAERIAADGRPFLIADASPNRARDIWLQHAGGDPEDGWLAFVARAPGQDDRDCSLQWVAADEGFADPCTGERFPADGRGLTHYATRVDEGVVYVDLREEVEPPPAG